MLCTQKVQDWTTVGASSMAQLAQLPDHHIAKTFYSVAIKECTVLNFRFGSVLLNVDMNMINIFLQSLITPNGLIAHLFGSIEGKRHDAFMLAENGLASKLMRFNQANGQPYIVYGDPAYGISRNILAPFVELS